jgi:hypothetical protein
VRVPLGTDLQTRNGNLSLDAKVINGLNEQAGESLGAIKRPGNASLGTIVGGTSQMLGSISASALAILNDTLKTVTPVAFSVTATDALSPVYAGLTFSSATKGRGANDNAVLIKTSKEAWVVT